MSNPVCAPWIWLPRNTYADCQTTRYDAFTADDSTFAVAEFCRKYEFGKKIAGVKLRFSGDTECQLFCNGSIVATGPAVVGGDFLGNGKPREWYYATEAEYHTEETCLDFFARVKMCPVHICEYSKGHGGFMLCAEVEFEDGSCEYIETDEGWLVRRNYGYVSPLVFDGTIENKAFVNAEKTEDIWSAETAPIPPRTENEIIAGEITLAAGETIKTVLPLDMIYAGFLHLYADCNGTTEASFIFRELDKNQDKCEKVTLSGKNDYRSFYLHSAGNIETEIKNNSESTAVVRVGFITTCYPVETDASTVTDDESVNRILDVCKHTLKYCRQTHHLDSPRHCEPLACTGDYYIETLMTAFSFGDMRLAEFDVLRTAELLRHNDGRIFHTTYSLIWVRMLYDTYMMSGNRALLEKCADALGMLLARFSTYVGDNGLIENPPDYMFVDWIYIDEITMHHPPKCLGQSVLNMFYYMALSYAERVYSVLGEKDSACQCAEKSKSLKNAINTLLYDSEKGMYFEGLNTPTDDSLLNSWHPQNIDKRYYLKQSNILAAYTCVCDTDTAVMLIDKIMSDEIGGDVQPYFMHYLLEAICTHGLRDRYTLKVIDRWKKCVEECPKGLAEGFVPPEPTYRFDHSHAWGGTPLYSLPKALLGLEICEPAFRKISLDPSLLGLETASVELPTPYGMVICKLEKGKTAAITAPDEITVDVK